MCLKGEEDGGGDGGVATKERYSAPAPSLHQAECLICMEEGNLYARVVCPEHKEYCQPCLQTHTSLEIKSARIPVACPHAGCSTVFDDRVVEAVFGLPEDTQHSKDFRQYLKFKQMKGNKDARECSKCGEICTPPPPGYSTSAGRSDDKPLQCKCGHVFCWEHGDVHPGKTCTEYRSTRSAESVAAEKETMDAIAKSTKPCPNCDALISHAGGCNHVVCSSCNKDFCWACGTDAHMTGKVVRSCKGCGGTYVDHREHARARCYTLLASPVWIVLYLLYLALLVLVYALTLCCCFCCVCGRVVPYDEATQEKPTRSDHFRVISQAIIGSLM